MAIFSTRPRIANIIAWTLLAAALIFALYVRGRLREFPLERDEGEFAYAGQLILHGVPPYTDKLAYNMKLPGTYIAYAALMAVFGQTTPGIHLGLLAVNLATIVLLYRFTRELFDPFSAGAAAIAYAILSESPAVLGMAAHATHFVAFFGLAGAYLLWRYVQSGRWWQALASGLLMGTAFLMKQQAVFLMVFGGVVVQTSAVAELVTSYHQGRFSLRQLLHLTLNGTVYCLGAILPYLGICLWLWHAGVFEKFWFWTVTYARQYVAEMPLSVAGLMFWQNANGIVLLNWTVLLLALAGCISLAIRGKEKPGLRPFVFAFLAFSFLCVCPGFYFRNHYFIVMLPAVAMLAGAGGGELCRLANLWQWSPAVPANEDTSRRKRRCSKSENVAETPVFRFAPLIIPAGLLAMGALVWPVCVGPVSAFFWTWPPLPACRAIYSANPFVECPAIARYLKEHTADNDTIAVIGSEPEVFFHSGRRSATGYIYTYGLMEAQPLAEAMQREMVAEIETSKPKYIVLVDVFYSWLYSGNSKFLIQQWADGYLRQNYDLVGIADRTEPFYHMQEDGTSLTPLFRPFKSSSGPMRNAAGERFKFGWLGNLGQYQPNPDDECVLWICRRK